MNPKIYSFQPEVQEPISFQQGTVVEKVKNTPYILEGGAQQVKKQAHFDVHG